MLKRIHIKHWYVKKRLELFDWCSCSLSSGINGSTSDAPWLWNKWFRGSVFKDGWGSLRFHAGRTGGYRLKGPSEVLRANLTGHAHISTVTSVCATTGSIGGRWPFGWMREPQCLVKDQAGCENLWQRERICQILCRMWEMGPAARNMSCIISALVVQ